jgi:peptidoglycan-associated lipoprotein
MSIQKFFITVLVILVTVSGFAQTAKEADEAFKYEQYADALLLYKKAYSKTKNKVEKKRILFQQAECYRLTKDPKKAEQQYRKLIQSKYSDPIAYLYLAESLRDQEKYQMATEEFKNYIKFVPDNPRGKLGLESCENAIDWKKNPTRYQVANLAKINSKEDDFSPAYGDKKFSSLVYSSSRKDGGQKIDPNTGLSFTSLYSTMVDAKGNWSKPLFLDEKSIINSPNDNNGSAIFNPKYTTLYFTRCKVTKKEVLGCGIYISTKKGKEWTEPELLPIADDSLRVGHPAISSNEKEIYFTSNLPKGYGGRDIWVAKRRKKNGAFEKPRNLGEEINSKGDERYPTLLETSDGHTYLYFSSDGRGGMGGWDMYRSELIEGNWTKAENLAYPLNSSSDDFGIIFSESRTLEKTLPSRQVIKCEQMGYFTSNRTGGKGRFDIWEFWLPEVVFTLAGTIRDDQTLKYLPNSNIQLSGTDGSVLVTTTDQRGYYFFNKDQISKNTTYTLKISHKNYFGNNASETTVGRPESEDIILNVRLVPIPPEPIPLPEIRYDLASAVLLPQYQDSLNGLIKTMKDNPTIVIELASHTDYRDTDEKNNDLSYRRAKAVVDYLATKGIDPMRMEPKGYGENQARKLTKTYTFAKGEYAGVSFPAGIVLTEAYITSLKSKNQQEAANQLNRRTEFRILRDDFVPKSTNNSINKDSIKIQINPNENKVPYVLVNDTMVVDCIISGNSYKFAFNGPESELRISLDMVMGLLSQHKLTKNSFDNTDAAFTEDGTVKDGEHFVIDRMRIGNKTVYDISAVCTHGQSFSVIIGSDVLTEFSSYSIDESIKSIVFE